MKIRHTEEPIVKAIKEHEAGAKIDDICQRVKISSSTFHNWRSKYSGLEANEAKRFGSWRTISLKSSYRTSC